jgi:hypothetical protein
MGLMQLMPDTYAWLTKMKGEIYEEGALTNPEPISSTGCITCPTSIKGSETGTQRLPV